MRRLFPLALLVSGCATSKYVAPTPGQIQLGRYQASYHDYRRSDLCRSEPNLVANELDGVNVLLAEFLQATSAGTEGVWAPEHLSLLQQATGSLGPALEVHEHAVQAAEQCTHSEESGLLDIARKGKELARQARKRVVRAAELARYGEARAKLIEWKNEEALQQQEAKARRCGRKSTRPTVYYTIEDERGRVEWHFCDGTKVVSEAGGAPKLSTRRDAPPDKAKLYIDAASRVPAQDVRRAPKLPPQKAGERRDELPANWLDEDLT